MYYDQREQLGFWGELLNTALQAGASVYSTKQNTKLQNAQLQAQVAQAKQQLENDKRARDLQLALQASQQGLQIVPATTPNGLPQLVAAAPQMAPSPNYDMTFGPAPMPSWVLPVALGGGALLLVLLLRR